MFIKWTYKTGYVFKYAAAVAAASTETGRVTIRRDDGALFYLRRVKCEGGGVVGTKGFLIEKSKGREFLLGRRLSDITFETK